MTSTPAQGRRCILPTVKQLEEFWHISFLTKLAILAGPFVDATLSEILKRGIKSIFHTGKLGVRNGKQYV
jgi:hypothetical protein